MFAYCWINTWFFLMKRLLLNIVIYNIYITCFFLSVIAYYVLQLFRALTLLRFTLLNFTLLNINQLISRPPAAQSGHVFNLDPITKPCLIREIMAKVWQGTSMSSSALNSHNKIGCPRVFIMKLIHVNFIMVFVHGQ